jgi:GTP-binding protein HflX
MVLTDTVGFIQKLPTTLVAAFRATLEELDEADLLLHVVDITHNNASDQIEVVEKILEELEVDQKPRILVMNKVDLLGPGVETGLLSDALGPPSVLTSAQTGLGLDTLLAMIQETIESPSDEPEVDLKAQTV